MKSNKSERQIPPVWKTKNLAVRDAVEKDLPQLRDVYQSCNYITEWTGYEPPQKDPLLAEYHHEILPPGGNPQKHRLQTVLAGEAIVGYAIYYHGYPDERCFWIAVLAIHKDHQKKEYGREFVKSLVDEISKLDTFNRINAAVSIKNWPALRFWFRSGFDTVEKLKLEGVHTPSTFGEIVLSKHLTFTSCG